MWFSVVSTLILNGIYTFYLYISRKNEKWLTLINMNQITHKGQLLLAKFYYNVHM